MREDQPQGKEATSAGPGKTRGILEEGVGGGEEKTMGMGTQPLGWAAMKAPPKMLILCIFHLLPGDPLMVSHQGRIWSGR